MGTIIGYEFAVADNDARLPSAAGTQNEVPMTTTLDEGEPEDAILVVSGLLPRLVERAKQEGMK